MAFYEKKNGEYVRVPVGGNVNAPSGGASVYIGPDKPTNGALYWLDTSGDVPVTPDVPVVTLTGITATYSGGNVTVGTAVTDLTGVVVTAHYSDGSTETVTGYTLSGTITEGNNTITVSYGGKTTTITVTGVAESGGGEEPDNPESGIFKLADIATEVEVGKDARGNTKSKYTRYKVENIKTGDIVRLAGANADNTSAWYDGTTSHNLNDQTKFVKKSQDNYAWMQYTWIADKDYEYLYFASNTGVLESHPNAAATIEKAVN